ncbi:MAG: hypothetical protein ACJAXV_000263 [Bacteroidia bacterium]|jgi:hypothetical protein
MLKKALVSFLFLMLLFGPLFTLKAQNNVGIGTLSPSSDAILDLFSNNKGFLTPRVTSAERATIPANSSGLLVFDTDENKFFYWNSALSLWQVMDDFSNTNEVLKLAEFDEATKQITLTDDGGTYTLDLNILSQQLSFSNDTLYISDKNGIDLQVYHKDSSTTNELLKTAEFEETTKRITLTDEGGTHNLDLNILSQELSFSNDSIYISDKNGIDLQIYHKDSSTTNELLKTAEFDETTKQITLMDEGGTYNLDLNILSQELSFSNDTLYISDKNAIDLQIYNKDSSTTNELQSLTTSNDSIFIDQRGFIKLSEDEFWNTDGNEGTDPLTHFIGTRDGQDFVMKTNSAERARILGANGNFGIGTPTPDEQLDVEGNIELSGGNRTVQTQVMTTNGSGFSLTLKASDNQNNGFNAQNGGNVFVQGGKGFNWSTGAGGGHVYLRSGANETQAGAGFRDGGYIIFETGSRNSTYIERARMLDNGNLGLGTTLPTSQLDLTGQIRIRGGVPGLGKVLTSDANGLATWKDGIPDVNNGLYVNNGANRIRLGGPLVENTTITQGAFGVTYNLSGTGDFNIQDNGINHFAVEDNGNTVLGGDMEWRDNSTAGTILAELIDNADDGRFMLMENGITSVDLNANTQFVFNEQGLDRNFRVESDDNANMIFADAGLNRVGIGTDIPDHALDVFGDIELSGGNRTIQTQVMTANGTGFSLTLKASDNQNNGFNAQSGGNVILQGGKGFNWSTGAGGGHVVIRSGANETNANAGLRDGGYIIFETGSRNSTYIERARMLDNGNFGIGTNNPVVKFQVGNSGDGSIARANSWTTFSDRRWKTKIVLITDALDKLHSINGYTYKWKEGADTSTQVGVIAQEIEAVLPEAVKTDENGYKSVDYGKLSALLIEAVKEQQTIITSLENKIHEQNTTTIGIQSVQKSLDQRLLILEQK